MVNLILKFVSSSRAAGLRISTSEVLDCMDQLRQINFLDEPQFEIVLRANFAKSRGDQIKFDRLYHLFFHELREDGGIKSFASISDHVEEILSELKNTVEQNQTFSSILEFLAGDPLSYIEEVQKIQSQDQERGHGFPGNMGEMTRNLSIMLSIGSVRKMISQFLSGNRNRIDWDERQALSEFFNRHLDSMLNLLNEKQIPDRIETKRFDSYEKRMSRLGEKTFWTLTPREVEEMREIIAKLVRKLKDTIGRRYAARNRGVPDLKKTLRRSAKYQGIPIEILFRKKSPRKGKIIVLCDVSGSVWSAAKFMLNMLYSLQECFTKVRSFIFVSGLDEVTEFFEKHEVDLAIEKILSEADVHYNDSTDYGLTFRQFKNKYMDILNKKTTLIVIGDGRSNYSNPEENIFKEMKEKCRRVIWLNPETKKFWHTGDSEIKTYRAYCDELRLCQNLNQLHDFIRDLVL